jgi:methyl-accepting chemotaxis protein
MKWFSNLKIGTKLISAFIMVSILAGVVGIVGITNIKSIDKKYGDLFINFGVAQGNIGRLGVAFNDTRSVIRDIIFLEDTNKRTENINKLKESDKKMSEDLKKVEKSLATDEGRTAFKNLSEALGKYNTTRDKVISLAISNQSKEAEALFYAEAAQPAKEVDFNINELFRLKTTTGDQLSSQYTDDTNSTVIVMLSVVIVAMVAAVLLGLFVSNLISKPIKQLMTAANKIADGDLDVSIDVDTKDEVGILASSFDKMSNNINEVMSNINNASEQVASGSKQVSDSSMELSQGATEQASSIEQLTASIEEISSQTKLNADNANEANELAEIAKENAVQGNGQMKEMLKAMEEINESSSNISKIIKVIDEIAFQTNILALNAAVEAARAGQHGKGFAVVAEEVRNLAARSANAAKETTAMIEGSIKKVEGGTKIATETAQALNKIVDGIAKVANIVGDIATASNEQATGISQINQGIMQVSEVVQTNSATSEESAAASEELSSQAELLREQVAKFKLKKTNYSSHSGMDQLSPEVLRMLENMNGSNKKQNQGLRSQSYEEAAVTKTKSKNIALSDKEFGKY